MATGEIITKKSLASFIMKEAKTHFNNSTPDKLFYAYTEKEIERIAGGILVIIQMHTPVKINTEP